MALEKLSELPRGEYETAVPDIATILRMTEVEAIARNNRSEIEKNRQLVVWDCPDCGYTMSAFLLPADVSKRRCPSHYRKLSQITKPSERSLPSGQICGGLMNSRVLEPEEKR